MAHFDISLFTVACFVSITCGPTVPGNTNTGTLLFCLIEWIFDVDGKERPTGGCTTGSQQGANQRFVADQGWCRRNHRFVWFSPLPSGSMWSDAVLFLSLIHEVFLLFSYISWKKLSVPFCLHFVLSRIPLSNAKHKCLFGCIKGFALDL